MKRILAALAMSALLVVGVGSPALAGNNHGGGHTPVTFCHNGHTITTDDDGEIKGHTKHIEDGKDTLGECVVVVPPPAFVPYGASVRWLLPASWPSTQTPTYQAAIFPQTRLTGDLTCGRWSQDDNYWMENTAESDTYNNLGGTLTQGEDSSIYKSHKFTYGGDCVVVPPKPPVLTTYTDWADGTWGCGDTTVSQTRSKSVIDYVLVNNVWVAQSAINTVETQIRDLSPGEYVPARQCITRPDDYNTYEWTQAGEPKCGEASYIQKGFIIKHVFTWNDEIINWKESTTREPTTRTVEITATPCPTETPTPTPTPTEPPVVVPPVTTPTPSPSVSETPVVTATPAAPSLAYTGSQTGFVLVVVLILVGAGVASVLIARRGTR